MMQRHSRYQINEKRYPKDVFLISLIVNLLSLMPVPCQAAVPVPGRSARSSASLGDLTFNGVFPRIFTPNSDGFNDKAVFHFDNPEQLPVSGHIYDIAGAVVASLPSGIDTLMWDGKDSDGRVVPGGIYLYKIEFQGKYLTGTVVVAR